MYAFVMSDTQAAGVAELILLDSNMLALSGEVQGHRKRWTVFETAIT